jgi:hypothetical protein
MGTVSVRHDCIDVERFGPVARYSSEQLGEEGRQEILAVASL